MKKNQQSKRFNDILFFIFQNKIILARQVEKMFFKTYKRAIHYLFSLEKGVPNFAIDPTKNIKGGLLQSKTIYSGLIREKVYFLTPKGIRYLAEIRDRINYRLKSGQIIDFIGNNAVLYLSKYGIIKYNINFRELYHDLTVIDILIYCIKHWEGFKSFKTDFTLRREMNIKNERHRLPDFMFEDEQGRYLVEYHSTDKVRKKVIGHFEDYKSFYPGIKVLLIVNPGREEFYKTTAKEANLKNYEIANFNLKTGIKPY